MSKIHVSHLIFNQGLKARELALFIHDVIQIITFIVVFII